MTTYVEAREALVTKINADLGADYPLLKVFYENTEKVDVNEVGDQFVEVQIDFLESRQATLEIFPKRRVLGEVTFTFSVKEGQGTKVTLGLYDYLCSRLEHKALGGVVLRTPTVGRKMNRDGWFISRFHVPFLFDSTP